MTIHELTILFPVLFPMLAGLAAFFVKGFKKPAAIRLFVTAALVLNCASVLFLTFGVPEISFTPFAITHTLPITLKADTLSRFFGVLVSTMWLLVGIFSFEYMKHEQNEERFFMFYLLTLGSVLGVCFAGNIISLYLFYEIMTLVSMPMVLHSMTKQAVSAALKYLFYSIAGASLALIGFFIFFSTGAPIDFVPGGAASLLANSDSKLLYLTACLLCILGFGTKAGMFPMHAWLPTAHPVAPAPASAVLSGVITKAGVLAIIRVVYYLFGADFIRGTFVQYAWVILSLITIFMGSMLAFKENQMKKRFAFSTVSQVSYILFGLAVLTGDGMLGALLHVVYHSVIKNGLFMVAGAIIYMTHKTNVDELAGIGKQMPVVMWCFTILSVALVGIPPTGGFVSKWFLAGGALISPLGSLSWIGPATLLISALLTAGYLLSISIRGFFPGADVDYGVLIPKEPNLLMTAPLLVVAAASVLLGIFPGALTPLFTDVIGSLF
jgi:multicomponent Na+:H+ antiporter subunit D